MILARVRHDATILIAEYPDVTIPGGFEGCSCGFYDGPGIFADVGCYCMLLRSHSKQQGLGLVVDERNVPLTQQGQASCKAVLTE